MKAISLSSGLIARAAGVAAVLALMLVASPRHAWAQG
jgi:hypothetical protein